MGVFKAKPIEVTNVRFQTALAEPVNGTGPMGKTSILVVGIVIGVILSGGVSCEKQEVPSKAPTSTVKPSATPSHKINR